MEILYRVKTYIRKGQVEEALDLLDEILQKGDKNLYNQVILLSSDYNDQVKRENKGLEWDARVVNRVKNTIIQIVDDLLESPSALPVHIQTLASTPTPAVVSNNGISKSIASDYASDLEKAKEARDVTDYNKVISLLSKYADNMDGEGYGILGWAYIDDRNTQNDYTKGILLLQEGIKREDPLSHYILGLMNYNGLGMTENDAAALKLFEKTLDITAEDSEEYIDSLAKLGTLHLSGLGTKKNTKKGLALLKDAVAKGSATAMNVLAKVYFDGTDGVKMDFDEALEYAEMGADAGLAACANIAGSIYYDREEYDSALPHLENAADEGYADAQLLLGRMYEDGMGVDEDKENAIELYKKSLDGEQYMAANNLGRMYLDGDGVPLDYTKAYHYFEKAHKAGVGIASFNLGIMYKNGFGVDKNKAAAESYFKIAVLKGYEQAQTELDSMKGFWGLFS
jgi:uncharacterized protein